MPLAPLLVLMACGGASSSSHPDMYSFLSKESGIKGSHSSATYRSSQIRPKIGSLACQTGPLAAYSESTASDGITTFTAACSSANKYEGLAAFTLNDVQKTGHISATIDGDLVRIKL